MKNQRLNLQSLQVKSFVTSLNHKNEGTVKGGGVSNGNKFCHIEDTDICPSIGTQQRNCITFNPAICFNTVTIAGNTVCNTCPATVPDSL